MGEGGTDMEKRGNGNGNGGWGMGNGEWGMGEGLRAGKPSLLLGGRRARQG